jgi:EF hand
MDKVLIAALVALGMVACERSTSPSSPNPAARPSAQVSRTAPQAPSAVPSQSGDSSQVAQLSFDSVDANKDGVITPNEALAVPGLDFSSADTDKSHTLDRQEFAAAMATTRPGG